MELFHFDYLNTLPLVLQGFLQLQISLLSLLILLYLFSLFVFLKLS